MGIFGKDDDQDPPRPVSNLQPGSNAQPGSNVQLDRSAVPAAAAGGAAPPRYVVSKGDSLSKIAERAYGDARKWRKIYEANRDVIKDPDLIYPGQALRIPE